ncbi:MAG: (deoxy)nucleoside triphosphate pyrophosphohydrolase [Phycisphaerae bacterium]|nr:(deoxy)nucleoside triphosphate pyrophosphohydrolase [Tepidisphaeraceae bacterium]
MAIGVVFRAGQVLIARRAKGDAFADLWEFPGGKCEPGEAAADCVRRELLEETRLEVESVEALPVIEHHYPQVSVRLHPFVCRYVSGEAAAVSSVEVRWVLPAELGSGYGFPEANAGLLRELVRRDFGASGY